MDEQQHADATVVESQALPDEPDYASYEDDDSLVICDRSSPSAWIKSDVFGDREV